MPLEYESVSDHDAEPLMSVGSDGEEVETFSSPSHGRRLSCRFAAAGTCVALVICAWAAVRSTPGRVMPMPQRPAWIMEQAISADSVSAMLQSSAAKVAEAKQLLAKAAALQEQAEQLQQQASGLAQETLKPAAPGGVSAPAGALRAPLSAVSTASVLALPGASKPQPYKMPPAGPGAKICGQIYCEASAVCCNGICGIANSSCCVGKILCQPMGTCCGDICCGPGAVCCNGICGAPGSLCTGTVVLAPPL